MLDVATGRGAVLFPAVKQVGPSGQVIGVDLSEGMVRETASEIERRGITSVRVMVMDAEQLDFPDESFDAVLCSFALFFFPHQLKTLREFRRILKPGGKLALSTWAKGDERFAWLESVFPKPGLQGTGKRLALYNPEAIKTVLEKLEFINVKTSLEEVDFIYKDAEEWWQTQWSHGSRRILEQLDETGLEQVKAKILAGLEQMQQPDGLHQLFRPIFTRAEKP